MPPDSCLVGFYGLDDMGKSILSIVHLPWQMQTDLSGHYITTHDVILQPTDLCS